jgi:DNA-binding NtrC family response regulator
MSTKKKILFVDDEPHILSALSNLFRTKDLRDEFEVLTAQSGEQALSVMQVQGSSIQVLVSDQRMPGMTGVMLLKAARDISPNTVRMLLTGYADLETVMASVNLGDVFRYINKPWDNNRLRETIIFACNMAERNSRMAVERELVSTAAPARDLFSDASLLVVMPNPMHQIAIKEMFSGQLTTYTAGTPEEAFSVLKTNPISIVIADASLGQFDGADFLTAVRQEYSNITSIIISDSKDSLFAIRLINESRVFRYLVKPFRRDELRQSVQDALKHHREQLANARTPVFTETLAAEQVAAAPTVNTFHEALLQARERLKKRLGY